MNRHSSISEQFVDELKTQFFETNELAKFANSWAETSTLLHTRTTQFSKALRLIREGAPLDEVQAVLRK